MVEPEDEKTLAPNENGAWKKFDLKKLNLICLGDVLGTTTGLD
jgi:hypothetical protein